MLITRNWGCVEVDGFGEGSLGRFSGFIFVVFLFDGGISQEAKLDGDRLGTEITGDGEK